jgi:outer membrane receptor for ferrienterochelin and colicins
MNAIYRIFLYTFLLVLPGVIQAQSVTILEAESAMPIPGAHVFCKNLTSNKEYTMLTDKEGRIALGETSGFGPMAITVYALGFERLDDTLESTTDKTIYLKHEVTGLNEFVVTAQYAPNNPEKAVHNIKIIDQKKIAAMAAVNLRDVLSNELNIRLAQDNILGSSMQLQGILGQNVKILVDGIPVIGRLDGDIDISQINMDNVERIEIVEGPLSVSYGTDALAGTINVITKKHPNKKWSTDVQTFYESTGNYNLNANIGYRYKNQTIKITGGRNYFDGWSPGDKQFDLNLHPVADSSRYKEWKPKEQYFTTLNYGYKWKELQCYYTFDYFNEVIKNRGYPEYYNTYIKASDDVYKTERLNNAISVDGNLSLKLRLNGVVAYNYYKRDKNSYVTDLSTLTQNLTTNDGDQDTSVYKTWMSRATISHYQDAAKINYEIGYDAKLESTIGQMIKDAKQSIGDYALFASMEWKPVKDLIIRPGLRLAYNTDYKAPLVPSLNMKYSIPTSGNGNVNIRGSYARGFRAPSLKELYYDFVDINHTILGNENLKAEYSNNYELSVNYIRAKGEWTYKTEVSGFYSAIRNKIDFAVDSAIYNPNQPGPVPQIYLNISDYKTMGVQLQQTVSYQHLKVTMGASYIGRYNQLSEAYKVASLSYSTELKANIFYELHKPQLTVGFFYKYNGSQPGFALNTDGALVNTNMAAFSWADCSVSKLFFKKKLGISTGSKNIFDVKDIAQTAAASGSPHSSGSGYQPIGTGRSYFISLAFHFNAD